MIKVPTLRICGFAVPALIALAACSGSPDPEIPRGSSTPPAPADVSAPSSLRNSRSSLGGRASRVLTGGSTLEQALANARKSLELRLFEDARNEAAFALELDNQNVEARDIVRRCNEILGDRPDTMAARIDDRLMQDRIAAERERFTVQKEMDQAKAHYELGAYGKSVDHYQRALAAMRFSIHFSADDPLRQELETRLKQAGEAKLKADKAAADRVKAMSEHELEAMQRDQKISRDLLIQGLFESANKAFQQGNYGQSVAYLDKALLYDPASAELLALRDLADRARHTADKDLHRERWKNDWTQTFQELQRANLPQTEVVKFDPVRWAQVSQRQPLAYSGGDEADLPESREIIKALNETRLEHNFASATVKDWATYYGNVTKVTFIVTPEVRDLDAASTTLTDFKLPRMPVANALKVIQAQTGVAWKVKDGMVLLVKPENAIGTLISARIPVGDIVQGVKNKPGPDLKLRAPGDDSPTFPEEEGDAPPSIVDDGRLKTLITTSIEPTKWEGTFSIGYQSGVLFVRADVATLEKVNALLADLRRHVGIQVDVEARFLKVEDNFLEDVGIDLRGLGNQASQGLPGRGLENNNRAGVGFDDFGQSQQLNPASPGVIGSGSEPGMFYDDGQDGDFLGRVENLYDHTLGGQNGGLNNAGGLSVQYAFLDDVELEVVLRAVSKQERSEEIHNPRLLINNNTRGSMSFLRNISYIRDFEVEIAQAAAVANPVVGVVHDGVALDVRPVVDADLRFITMELRPTVMQLQLPIPTFTTTLGVGQPISIQLPSVTLQRVRTIVTMPDGGTMMLGGMKLVERMNLMSGVPLLKDLPGLSFLFSRKGTSVLNRKILILIRAKIILMSEHEPAAVTLPDGSVLMSSR